VGIETGTEESNRFVEFFLRSKKHEIRQASYSSGGQPNIKLEYLNPYPLALPPLSEQKEIVHRVESLFALADRLAARFVDARRRVDSITQAILAKAFRGELVPTEFKLAEAEGRSFESAEELLARIRATSDASPNGNGSKPRKQKSKHT
jgi:type I restriction enzyme S subunit